MRGKGMSFLRKIFFGVVGCLMLPSLALAGPNVTFFNVQVMPGKQGEVIQGVQEFMATKMDKIFRLAARQYYSFNGRAGHSYFRCFTHGRKRLKLGINLNFEQGLGKLDAET